MKELENAILTKGKIINNDIIKVDSFVNHQVDPILTRKVAKFFAKEFKDVDKVLTIETSGIPFAFAVAEELKVPMVFAKKSKSQIVDTSNVYVENIKSFTRGIVSPVSVSKEYLLKGERVLIVDDFLASGTAALGLVSIIKQAGATCAGVCAVIEKSFQGGRDLLTKDGYKVISAANIVAFKDNKPIFAK